MYPIAVPVRIPAYRGVDRGLAWANRAMRSRQDMVTVRSPLFGADRVVIEEAAVEGGGGGVLGGGDLDGRPGTSFPDSGEAGVLRGVDPGGVVQLERGFAGADGTECAGLVAAVGDGHPVGGQRVPAGGGGHLVVGAGEVPVIVPVDVEPEHRPGGRHQLPPPAAAHAVRDGIPIVPRRSHRTSGTSPAMSRHARVAGGHRLLARRGPPPGSTVTRQHSAISGRSSLRRLPAYRYGSPPARPISSRNGTSGHGVTRVSACA